MADTPIKAQDAPKAPNADKSDATKAAADARAADAKAIEAQEKADEADKSKEQVAADKAKADADDARAAAVQADAEAVAVVDPNAPTTALQAKADSAVTEPDRAIGDHHAQRFSNTPENPPLVPGLDPDFEGKVKVTMETSDSLAAGAPMVAYVHPDMLGDYLRAGWSRG